MNCWKFQRLYLSLDTPVIKERVGAKFTIGRDRDSLIQCRSTYVSRKHLKIELLPSRTWTIRDCGSLNGTFVNKSRLRKGERRELKEGDVVGVGVADICDHYDIRSSNSSSNLFVFKFEKVYPRLDIQRAKLRKRLFRARMNRRQKLRSKLSGLSSGESASCEGSSGGPPKKKKKVSSHKKKRHDNDESSESTRGESSSDELSKSSESDDESVVLMSCQICWDKFAMIKKAGKDLHSTPCGHIFCYSCINKSLTVNPHCPVCRTSVQPGSTHRIFL